MKDRGSYRPLMLLCLGVFVMVFLLCRTVYAAAQKEEKEIAADTFHAIILSDLHYTTKKDASDVIVSGMGYADEIADLIVKEVIARKPDVFIMTGDNTNGGGERDVLALVRKLERIREAGIRVVVTTGNHDYNNMDAGTYEEFYFPLFDIAERDEASLSYVTLVGDVALLAMDDNAVAPGGQGYFSKRTMAWLEAMLEKYKEYTILFLSHHNLLLGNGMENSANFQIQNPDLADLLRNYGVRLALTGHFHAQIILEEDGLYEIVSSMPYNYPYLLGDLCIEDGTISYSAAPIAFAEYGGDAGKEMLRILEEKNVRNWELQRQTLTAAVRDSDYDLEMQEKILDLLIRFLQYYTEGSMAEHIPEIRADEAYEPMLDALWEKNYGPWMKMVMDSEPLDARNLIISTTIP